MQTQPRREVEEWRPVPGLTGCEASSLGRIRSEKFGNEPRVGVLNGPGYRKVTVNMRKFWVHRLVCAAFHGPAPDGFQCAHLDGNPGNNVPSNLRWVSRVENEAHKRAHGTALIGSRNHQAKLTPADADAIRSAEGPRAVIAARFGVSETQVQRIQTGENWAPQRRDWSDKTPPFALTDEQRAKIDAVRSTDAKTMLLQVYHQTWCYAHRPIVGVFGSLDPAAFSRDWNAHQAEHMAEAWGAYLGADLLQAAE